MTNLPEKLNAAHTSYTDGARELSDASDHIANLEQRLSLIKDLGKQLLELDPRNGALINDATATPAKAWETVDEGKASLAEAAEGTQNPTLQDAVKKSGPKMDYYRLNYGDALWSTEHVTEVTRAAFSLLGSFLYNIDEMLAETNQKKTWLASASINAADIAIDINDYRDNV